MKLRLARKIDRWCNPSLADMEGAPVDRDSLSARARRYRRSTRISARRAIVRYQRRVRRARAATWLKPVPATVSPVFSPASMMQTLRSMPPRRYTVPDNV